MYPGPARGGGGGATTTLSSIAVGSHHCAWTDHGRLSVHTTLGIDPGSTIDVRCPVAAVVVGRFSFLDTLARLLGPAVGDQFLQHDDAPDAARRGQPPLQRQPGQASPVPVHGHCSLWVSGPKDVIAPRHHQDP
jgi:hypothetical protein